MRDNMVIMKTSKVNTSVGTYCRLSDHKIIIPFQFKSTENIVIVNRFCNPMWQIQQILHRFWRFEFVFNRILSNWLLIWVRAESKIVMNIKIWIRLSRILFRIQESEIVLFWICDILAASLICPFVMLFVYLNTLVFSTFSLNFF